MCLHRCLALSDGGWLQRGSSSAYDASYAVLAQQLDMPLLTLDERLARTARRLCRVRTPSS